MPSLHLVKERVLQLKVSLKDISPPIWRRFQVPGDYNLTDLHVIIQVLMDWEDYHLHKFTIDEKSYCPLEPDLDMFGENIDETKVLLKQLLKTEKTTFLYEYDFGDGWELKLVLEKILELEPETQCPRCLTGKRSGPPEDSGGPWGYEFFLDNFSDPDSEDHEYAKELAGPDFDPEHFSVDDINEELLRITG